MYDAWFRIWRDTYVPKLVVGDLLYFVKKDSSLGNAKWTMGIVEDINRGRDVVICEAVIKYCDSSE